MEKKRCISGNGLRTCITQTVQSQFTLSEIAQIALGAKNLNNDNIHILHTLIDLLLKKLGCQNENVYIGGADAACMERILKCAKFSPIPVNDEHMDIVTKRIEALECWEQRIKILETKLECHFQEIEQQYEAREDTKWMGRFWEFYSLPIEDLCTTCEPENELACSLLKNKFFMMKLLRRISYPLVERIFILERKIEELHKAFTEFLKRMEEVFAKMKLIEQVVIEVEKLRSEIKEHYLEFIATMEEVQQMLDAKFDKVHIPALKKYLKEKFAEINALIDELKKAKDCPRAAGIIMENIKCLSCLNTKVCSDLEPPPYIAPDLKKPFKKEKCDCKQKVPIDIPTIVETIPKIDKEIIEKRRRKRRENITCAPKLSNRTKFYEEIDKRWINETFDQKKIFD